MSDFCWSFILSHLPKSNLSLLICLLDHLAEGCPACLPAPALIIAFQSPSFSHLPSFGCCQLELFVCSSRINLKRRLLLLLLLMLIIKVDSTATEICPHRTAVIATNYHHSGWLDASLDEDDAWLFLDDVLLVVVLQYCSSVELFFSTTIRPPKRMCRTR